MHIRDYGYHWLLRVIYLLKLYYFETVQTEAYEWSGIHKKNLTDRLGLEQTSKDGKLHLAHIYDHVCNLTFADIFLRGLSRLCLKREQIQTLPTASRSLMR